MALRLADRVHPRERLAGQGQVVLALDGLPPDVGHEVLWVLLARSLLGSTEAELAPLLREVAAALPVPIRGVVSDGQESVRNAVRTALSDVPHQLCQFHDLREAAKPAFEADRNAKVLLKKGVRGMRPIARALEGRDDAEAQAVRGYCLAVRGALTDDVRPPLCASGLKLYDRLVAVRASIGRVAEKGGSRRNSAASGSPSSAASRPPPTAGPPSASPTAESTARRICSPITTTGRPRRSAPTTGRSSRRWPPGGAASTRWPRRPTSSSR